jgi:hypothetical protein
LDQRDAERTVRVQGKTGAECAKRRFVEIKAEPIAAARKPLPLALGKYKESARRDSPRKALGASFANLIDA